jgi:hypothetical protein
MFPNQKKYLSLPFNLLKSEIQAQETSLKKKKEGNVSNVPKSKKKYLSPPLTYSSRSPSPGDISKEKKERER